MRPPFGGGVPGNRWDLADDAAPRRTVSVIVAHYDQQQQLDRTLAALARQSYPAELVEIVVADDGSPREPVVPAGVTLVRQDDLGFRLAAARNLGVRHSGGELLCFLDSDTAPEPDYLERMTRLPAAVPETVTVGRRRHADFAAADPHEPVEAAAPRHPLPEPTWLADEYRRSRDLLDADDRSYRHVIGAVIGCSRWFFDEVGGFDESFQAYGGEDWEWAHRAWSAGAVFAHVPDAVAWHDGPEWAGRDLVEAQRRKNVETLRLSAAIPVDGSRPHALWAGSSQATVVLAEASGPAQAFVCVDSVLAALPHARVVVPPHLLDVFAADPRVVADAPKRGVVVRLASAVRVVDAGALRVAVGEVGSGDLATVTFGKDVVVESVRALHRRRRWGGDAGWRDEERPDDGLIPVPDEPDLEAYLGGWG